MSKFVEVSNNTFCGDTGKIFIGVSDETSLAVAKSESLKFHIYTSPVLVTVRGLTCLAGGEAERYFKAARRRDAWHRFVGFMCFWRRWF